MQRLINVGNNSYNMDEYKILNKFYYQPMSGFGVRQLSREIGIDTKTVMKQLDELVAKRIIIRVQEKGKFPHYEANRLSLEYKFMKSHELTEKLIESGLMRFLETNLNPKAIVLFGSAQKGTYHEKSDIDIFVYGKQSRINLEKFERKIGHKIQLLFEDDLKRLSEGLLGNIYNGQVLSGKLDVIT